MDLPTKRLIKASLITPWVVMPVAALYSLWYLLSWIGKPLPDPSVSLIWPHPFRPWESIFLYSLYGVPTAYLSLLAVGLPCYFIARKLNKLGYSTAIFAAVLACIPAAAFYGGAYSFWVVYRFLILFGVPLALAFTWMVKVKAEPPHSPKPLSPSASEAG